MFKNLIDKRASRDAQRKKRRAKIIAKLKKHDPMIRRVLSALKETMPEYGSRFSNVHSPDIEDGFIRWRIGGWLFFGKDLTVDANIKGGDVVSFEVGYGFELGDTQDTSEKSLVEKNNRTDDRAITRYFYAWKNNAKRITLYKRECHVLARGALNSCLIEFTDNHQREIVSRNAIRKVKA